MAVSCCRGDGSWSPRPPRRRGSRTHLEISLATPGGHTLEPSHPCGLTLQMSLQSAQRVSGARVPGQGDGYPWVGAPEGCREPGACTSGTLRGLCTPVQARDALCCFEYLWRVESRTTDGLPFAVAFTFYQPSPYSFEKGRSRHEGLSLLQNSQGSVSCL